jgi:hypothetical protein
MALGLPDLGRAYEPNQPNPKRLCAINGASVDAEEAEWYGEHHSSHRPRFCLQLKLSGCN